LQLNGRTVFVTDGNLEKAMRKFKKKIQASGLLQDLRGRESYVKPTTQRKTAKSLAKKRWQRYLSTNELPKRKY